MLHCCGVLPRRVHDHLQLSLKDASTYADIRDVGLSYEQVTRGFSHEQIMKSFAAPDPTLDDGGPTDMEVDWVNDKEREAEGKR